MLWISGFFIGYGVRGLFGNIVARTCYRVGHRLGKLFRPDEPTGWAYIVHTHPYEGDDDG